MFSHQKRTLYPFCTPFSLDLQRRVQRYMMRNMALPDPAPHILLHRIFDGSPTPISDSWQSPTVSLPFGATAVVPSWNLSAPDEATVHVALQVQLTPLTPAAGDHNAAEWSGWLEIAQWNAAPADPEAPELARRTSLSLAGSTAPVTLDTDTLTSAPDHRITAVRMRIRVSDSTETPPATPVMLHFAAVMGSADATAPAASTPLRPPARPALQVPARSQMRHRDHYPAVGGGGAAWCSPTTTLMLQTYWNGVPPRAEHSIPAAALRTFDPAFGGTGNWSFNTALAGRRTDDARPLEAFVTRLHSLDEAQRLTDAGVPLGASVSFTAEQLPEAGYETAGHLLVITGFTADGDVAVNDPAAPDDAGVPRVYPRQRFDEAWRRSGRTVYIVHPVELPLPAPDFDEPAW